MTNGRISGRSAGSVGVLLLLSGAAGCGSDVTVPFGTPSHGGAGEGGAGAAGGAGGSGAIGASGGTAGSGAIGASGGTAGSGAIGGAGATGGEGAAGGAEGGSAGTGGGGPCPLDCSVDLHSVIDCHGNVVQACGPDEGCSPNGTCVSACLSATLNASSYGCEFYSATPAVITEGAGSCFAAVLANTWTAPITIAASYGAQTFNAAQFTYIPSGQGPGLSYQPMGASLAPGEVGILFLSKYESGGISQVDCPVPQALEMDTSLDGTGLGESFHLTTSAPIVAYDVFPWGGSASYVGSASLLLPTSTWGMNFVVADAWGPLHGNPFTQITAAEDDTTVTVLPVAAVTGGGGVPAMTAGVPSDIVLDRGQIAQLLQPVRLAGTVVAADKPISVWGGSSCMNIPSAQVACDAAHQQLVPVRSLGSEYVAARYPSRGGDDAAPITMVGTVDGTTLSYEPMPVGAPTALSSGELAVFDATEPFVVRSQDAAHPFFLAAHMTGGGTNSAGLGDPEFVNLMPPAQYLDSYLFVTDPTYDNTALVFSRQKAADQSFHDVTLDCLGPIADADWEPVGTSGDYEVARVLIVDDGVGLGSCENGVHTATSDVPFGLWVWGYDYYVSYAYPAGTRVEAINAVVVPATP